MASHRSLRFTIAGKLTRVTSTGRFIPEIDGLRFVAIFAVIFFHLGINLASRNPTDYNFNEPGSVTRTVLHSGDVGVELFFIVSGFVLGLPFARHHLRGGPKIKLKEYFLRRVTRLEPPYFIAMIGIFLVLVIVHGRSLSHLFPHLLASLGYMHDLVYGQDSLVNNVAWSLEVEIQFYLLVPMLTLVFAIRQPRHRRLVLAGSIVIMSIIGPAIAQRSPHLDRSILQYSQFFLVGFLLADLLAMDQLRPARRSAWWDLVIVAVIPLIIMLHTRSGITSWLVGSADVKSQQALVLLPWLCFAAYLGVFRGVIANKLLTMRWIVTIGGMCYSVYLLHNALLNNILSASSGIAPTGSYTLNVAFQAVVMVPCIILVSVLFFVVIERPCMNKNWPYKLRASLSRRVKLSSSDQSRSG